MSKQRTSDGRYTFTLDKPCVCGHGLDYHTAEKPRACGNYGTGLIDCDCLNYRLSRRLSKTNESPTPEHKVIGESYV